MGFLWVVFAHEWAYRLNSSQNLIDQSFLNYTANSWAFTLVENGYYAVDIFLFIGGYVGILATAKYINELKDFKGALNSPYDLLKSVVLVFYCILKRYIRIMPAYAFMMLFYW